MAINFKGVSTNDLKCLLKIVDNSKISGQISREIERRSELEKFLSQKDFTSDRFPDYNFDFVTKCNQLMLEFDVSRLPKLWQSTCFDSGNNSNGDFYIGMFGKDKDALERKWMHNLGYISLLFADENLRRDYEGSYNTVNYLINGIYKDLNSGNVSSVDDLFLEFDERKAIATERFRDIVYYLCSVRQGVYGARSSIGNHGLTVNARKVTDGVSNHQAALIEAIAYGCSLDELKSENYEGTKRLIYVPQSKMKK